MTIKKANSENEIYVVGVDMDNRSPEEIAKDAALQIVEPSMTAGNKEVLQICRQNSYTMLFIL